MEELQNRLCSCSGSRGLADEMIGQPKMSIQRHHVNQNYRSGYPTIGTLISMKGILLPNTLLHQLNADLGLCLAIINHAAKMLNHSPSWFMLSSKITTDISYDALIPAVVFTVLALCVVALRWYSRLVLKPRSISLEDYFVTAAMVCN
jgi:hypothetical protein